MQPLMTHHSYVISIEQNLVQLCDSSALRCDLTEGALETVSKNTLPGTMVPVLTTEPIKVATVGTNK